MLSPEPSGSDATLPQCPTGTLVSWTNDVAILAPAWCRRWRCPECGRRKAFKLARRILATSATRFVTLTKRHQPGSSPQAQLDAMNAAWRVLWKRLKRRFHGAVLGYVKVVELHKSGAPHLHLAIQMPFIHQRTLSAMWYEIAGSPIVDIRAIKSQRGLAKYLSKYLTKCTDVLAHHRKWSQSKSFLPQLPVKPLEGGEITLSWKWTSLTRERFEAALTEAEWVEISGIWWRNKPPEL